MGDSISTLFNKNSNWTIYVHTADHTASSDSHVTIKLFGDKGEVSSEIRLDNVFRKDFERGHIANFRIKKQLLVSFTEKTKLASIELWKSSFGPFPDWNIDLIVVEPRTGNIKFNFSGQNKDWITRDEIARRRFTFPVFRWIKPGRHYTLR